MKSRQNYPGQFSVTPDLFHVTIPQVEIVQEMVVRGDQQVLNDICLAVAVIAEAIQTAQDLITE